MRLCTQTLRYDKDQLKTIDNNNLWLQSAVYVSIFGRTSKRCVVHLVYTTLLIPLSQTSTKLIF